MLGLFWSHTPSERASLLLPELSLFSCLCCQDSLLHSPPGLRRGRSSLGFYSNPEAVGPRVSISGGRYSLTSLATLDRAWASELFCLYDIPGSRVKCLIFRQKQLLKLQHSYLSDYRLLNKNWSRSTPWLFRFILERSPS